LRFELDGEQSLLQQSLRELLEKESSLQQSRPLMESSAEGYSKSFYRQLASLGYLGIGVPEDRGGAGAGYVALAAALHAMGRVALPGPILDLLEAIEVLRRLPGEEARRWCDRALAGDALVCLAHREPHSAREASPRTRIDPATGSIAGRKVFVPFGASADALIVTTDRGLAIAPRPDAGWDARPLETVDHAQRFADVTLAGPAVELAEGEVARCAVEGAERVGALDAAAFLLGMMERVLEMSVAYLKDRRAFGVPIGSFQALQHRAADMLLYTENTRAAVYRAAWSCDCDPESAALQVAAAKAYAGDAARFVCREGIQVFGGVGFTWEYDLHIFYKRTKMLEEFHGSTRDQLEQLLQVQGI
jgi:alkylation response protein AidB-like acyl-CoA dehydrogenase